MSINLLSDAVRLSLNGGQGAKAQARTYVRANAALDSVNASMFFGEPFTLVVRDALTPDEERMLLAGPGVLYVREETPAALPPA